MLKEISMQKVAYSLNIRRGVVFSTSLFIALISVPASAQQATPFDGASAGLTPAQNNAVNLLIPLTRIPTTNTQFWDSVRNQSVAISNGNADPVFNILTPYTSTDPNTLTSQKIAIYDAPYTRPNLYQLADGLGSNLGA